MLVVVATTLIHLSSPIHENFFARMLFHFLPFPFCLGAPVLGLRQLCECCCCGCCGCCCACTSRVRATLEMCANRLGPSGIPPYQRETTTNTLSSCRICNKWANREPAPSSPSSLLSCFTTHTTAFSFAAESAGVFLFLRLFPGGSLRLSADADAE